MSINDEYVDLTGFLEGGEYCRSHWSTISFETEPKESEWEAMESFQRRAREFLQNILDLNLPNIWSLDVNRINEKAIVKSNTYPGRHRAKSIYLDFRHFLARKEPSNFQRVIRSLQNNIKSDDLIQIFLNYLNVKFIKEQDHGIEVNNKTLAVSKLINIWFNTEFFHAGNNDQQNQREIWLSVLEDESAQQLLFWEILQTQHIIRSLYACLKDLKKGSSSVINCPDRNIILR